MRNLLLGAFLLGTTALFPVQAHAMPIVTGFLGGILTSLGATSLGGAIAGIGGFSAAGFAAGVGFAASSIGGALISTALSIGISYLAASLQHVQMKPDQHLVNLRQPISYFEFAYGRVRKGGPVYFWKGLDGKRYYGVILAAHEIDSLIGRYCDEPEVTLDANGVVQEDKYREAIQIAEYLGAPGQGAPALLEDNFPQWTSAHDMAGLAHAVIVASNVKSSKFTQVYPSGREPVYTALLDGKKVYDPRDSSQSLSDRSTWKTTTNAALIIADWITSKDGLGRAVDWEGNVVAEANAADVSVTDRQGNGLPKWQIGYVYSANDDRETVRAALGAACDCFFSEDENGNVYFQVGRYVVPDVTLVDSDFISIKFSEGQAGTDVVNAQIVEYTEPEVGYVQQPAAAYIDTDALETEAYEESSLQIYAIPNHNQAVRVEKRLLKVARAKYKISGTAKYQGTKLRKKRFFRLTHTEFGIDTVFEVDRIARNDDGITWTVEAHSTDSTDFDFIAATEEPPKPSRDTIHATDDVPDPTGVAAEVVKVAGSIVIKVTWDTPPRESLLNQVRYREHDTGGGIPGDWQILDVPVGQFFQQIVAIVDGETYDVQARALTATGRASKWVPHSGDDEDDATLSLTVHLDTIAPQDLLTFSAADGTGEFIVNFGTENDPHLSSVAIYKVVSGGTLDRANDLVTRPAVAPGVSYSIPVTSSPGNFDIYAEPMNASGIAGTLEGPASVTVS